MKCFRPRDFGRGVRLASTGAYLPAQVIRNEDLVQRGTPMTAAQMQHACGIEERRYASGDEATSDLAVHACQRALEAGGFPPAAVERLILATVSPDHPSPSTACLVHRQLGLGRAPAFDVAASCSGFLYALDVGARAVTTGDACVLAVAADIRSRFVDPKDPATAPLFGDGAAAAVLVPGPVGQGLLSVGLLADGTGAHAVYVPAGGSREPATEQTVRARRHFLRMEQGPQVYLTAVEGMLETAQALLDTEGVRLADVRLVVPHQPNRRILERLAKLGRMSNGQLFIDIARKGNVSAASCALALDAALQSVPLRPGDLVLLVTAGAGYTAGAALMTVDEGLLAAARRSSGQRPS